MQVRRERRNGSAVSVKPGASEATRIEGEGREITISTNRACFGLFCDAQSSDFAETWVLSQPLPCLGGKRKDGKKVLSVQRREIKTSGCTMRP